MKKSKENEQNSRKWTIMNKPSDNKTLMCSFRYGSRRAVFFFLPLHEIETRNYRRMKETKRKRTKKQRRWRRREKKLKTKMTRLLHNINLMSPKRYVKGKENKMFISFLSTFYSDKWLKLELKNGKIFENKEKHTQKKRVK